MDGCRKFVSSDTPLGGSLESEVKWVNVSAMKGPFMFGVKGREAVFKELLRKGNSGMGSMRWSAILHKPSYINLTWNNDRNQVIVKPREYLTVPFIVTVLPLFSNK